MLLLLLQLVLPRLASFLICSFSPSPESGNEPRDTQMWRKITIAVVHEITFLVFCAKDVKDYYFWVVLCGLLFFFQTKRNQLMSCSGVCGRDWMPGASERSGRSGYDMTARFKFSFLCILSASNTLSRDACVCVCVIPAVLLQE